MFSTPGDGTPTRPSELYEADGELFEIRYVDAAAAATWACERGVVFHSADPTVPTLAHLD